MVRGRSGGWKPAWLLVLGYAGHGLKDFWQERVLRRLGDLIETVRAAANSDPEIAALYREKRDELITDARHIATALAARGDLRENLTVTEAADHLNAITGPELHRVVVIDRGWTPERYRAWTRRNLENYLLKPPT